MRKNVKAAIAIILISAFALSLTARTIPFVKADYAGDLWVERAPMPYASSNFAAVTLDGKIYAISTRFTCVYDPSTNSWSTEAPMPNSFYVYAIGGVTAYNGAIYVFEGNGSSAEYSGSAIEGFGDVSTIVYNPITDKWGTLTSMPKPVSSMQANTVGDKIYIIGGWLEAKQTANYAIYENIISNATQVYTPSNDSWKILAPMPIPVMSYSSAVIGDKIYIIGGNSANSTVTSIQIYDTATNTWSLGKLPPNSYNRFGAVAATTGLFAPARLYVFGVSMNSDDIVNGTRPLIYNPASGSWTTGASMPTPRTGFAIAVVNDTLYVLGGTNFKPDPSNPMVPISLATNEQYFPIGYQSSSSIPEFSLLAILSLFISMLSVAVVNRHRFQKSLSRSFSAASIMVTKHYSFSCCNTYYSSCPLGVIKHEATAT